MSTDARGPRERDAAKRRNQHEWYFMASNISFGDSHDDLVYCQLCNQWQVDGWNNGKPFKMTQEEFVKLYVDGKIDASEVLGPREKLAGL